MEGAEYKEISGNLKISIATLKRHLQNVFKKTGKTSRIELVMFFKS